MKLRVFSNTGVCILGFSLLTWAAPAPKPAAKPAARKSAPAKKPAPVKARRALAVRASQASAPMYFRIGQAEITPVGFADFTAVWRSSNVGSGIGTGFPGIPFGNTLAGNESEFRFSEQNSRIGFKVTAHPDDFDVTGYMEADFLGVQPPNAYVSSNSNSLRMRLYWVDVKKDGWELLAGQTWSLLTPNRRGLSPLPGDLFFTDNMDTNYQVGLVWGRIPEIRLVRHINRHWTAGIAFDSPEQYIGGAVTLPGAYAPQLDNGSNLATPNYAPDVIGKIAFDSSHNAPRIHLELGGVFRTFRVDNPTTFVAQKATGDGVTLNGNIGLTKKIHLIANSFYGQGVGRYIFGMGPDVIVRSNGSVSPVHAGAGIGGFEVSPNAQWTWFTYYGGAYFQRDFTGSGKSALGYGFLGSASSNNRAIQEFTTGLVHTFWSDPKIGALQFISQYSYLWRNPWSVAAGAPRSAHSNMIFADLRYVLP